MMFTMPIYTLWHADCGLTHGKVNASRVSSCAKSELPQSMQSWPRETYSPLRSVIDMLLVSSPDGVGLSPIEDAEGHSLEAINIAKSS
jgi:hypothetical protein